MAHESLRDQLRLILVTPDREDLATDELDSLVANGVQGGVTSIMFREKRLSDSEFVVQAKRLGEVAGKSGGRRLILNERMHLSGLIEPDMLHLTWRSQIPADWCPSVPVGRSVHTVEEGRDVEAEVDYLIFGPIYSTPSKEGLVEAQGVDLLAELCQSIAVPVVAIGGINPERARLCCGAGAVGVAALSGLQQGIAAEFAAAVSEGVA